MSGDHSSSPGRGPRSPRRAPTGGAEPATDAPLRFEDPRSIRALAHPARMAIIDALASGEELTATDCAAVAGLTPSATAYHLKLLERFGFAEPAPPRRDGRERPWRATSGAAVDLDASTPARAAAASAVVAAHIDTTRALAVAFAEASHAETARWRDAGTLASGDLWLTVDEVEQVGRRLAEVVDEYRRRARPDERPAGARRVRVMNVVVPHRRSSGDA